ncbi:hypothetical protein [Stappia albiluteola]|nr:hypothetical protein [Stappia albiluteola]
MSRTETGDIVGMPLQMAALAVGLRERDIVYWGPACGRFRG